MESPKTNLEKLLENKELFEATKAIVFACGQRTNITLADRCVQIVNLLSCPAGKIRASRVGERVFAKSASLNCIIFDRGQIV